MQASEGTDKYIDLLIERDHWKNQLNNEQMQFIQNRESFYMATSSADGRPYMQHRGAKKGFIQTPSSSSLWFPDFGGNKQYISTGNLSENNKAFLFFMDYPNQRRLKLWGTATDVQVPERGSVERIILFKICALDENCPKHILKCYTDEEYGGRLHKMELEIKRLKNRMQKLEKEHI